jgi:hypothetical protein
LLLHLLPCLQRSPPAKGQHLLLLPLCEHLQCLLLLLSLHLHCWAQMLMALTVDHCSGWPLLLLAPAVSPMPVAAVSSSLMM